MYRSNVRSLEGGGGGFRRTAIFRAQTKQTHFHSSSTSCRGEKEKAATVCPRTETPWWVILLKHFFAFPTIFRIRCSSWTHKHKGVRLYSVGRPPTWFWPPKQVSQSLYRGRVVSCAWDTALMIEEKRTQKAWLCKICFNWFFSRFLEFDKKLSLFEILRGTL